MVNQYTNHKKKLWIHQHKNWHFSASDDRGIGIVRGRILDFASTKTIFSKGFKLIILDEADAMTNDAQNALRRGKTIDFIFVENEISFWSVNVPF